MKMILSQDPDTISDDNVFPKTSELIGDDFFKIFMKGINRNKYRNDLDFLLCFFFPNLKKYCFSYYLGETDRKAKDILSKKSIKDMDKLMYSKLMIFKIKKMGWKDEK